MSLTLPPIDVAFWESQNEFYSAERLTQNVQIGLRHAAKAGLIDSTAFATNRELVDAIAERIQRYTHPDEFSDTELLTLFDLIQGWGGKTGRGPYVRPKAAPPRLTDPRYPALYRRAVELLFAIDEDDFDQAEIDRADRALCQLPGIAQSYSTKHLCFWSRSIAGCPSLAIYDTRMVLLFRAANPDVRGPLSYLDFLAALKRTGASIGRRADQVESALFAFSSNYFTNDALRLRERVAIDHADRALAEQLAETANR